MMSNGFSFKTILQHTGLHATEVHNRNNFFFVMQFLGGKLAK